MKKKNKINSQLSNKRSQQERKSKKHLPHDHWEISCEIERRQSASGENDEEQKLDFDIPSSGDRQQPQEFLTTSESQEFLDTTVKLSSRNLVFQKLAVNSSSARKRLLRDFNRLHVTPPNGVLGAPIDSNVMKWRGIVFGNDGSTWEGGIFKVGLEFTDAYPFKAPTVHFQTKLFHPNVGPNGEILLDMLGKSWTPAYDVADILVSIQRLLCNPNLEAVVNSEANALFRHNRIEYNRRVKFMVEHSVIYETRRYSI